MRDLLVSANKDLLHQITTTQELLGAATVPGELTRYRSDIERICDQLRLGVLRSLKDLQYNLPDTFALILQQTQQWTSVFELINTRLVGPVIRSRPEDRIALIFLRWLHDEHPSAAGRSFAVSDGGFAIYPTADWPILYFLPSSRQRTFHYLPLLFHEFGHLLYVLCEREMDDLVADFQTVVSDALAPMTVRHRAGADVQDAFRKQAVLAWYEWVQEFFCDAVGLTIGGPCFLKAFWNYFRTRSVDEFYLPRNKQLASRHPVTWLRIRMLADRARKFGLTREADEIEEGWHVTAKTLGVREEYEGMWTEEFFVPLRKTLDDMLEESSPRKFSGDDLKPYAETGSLLALLQESWRTFESNPAGYRAWEKGMIDLLLRSK
jgi:hypothetical protein